MYWQCDFICKYVKLKLYITTIRYPRILQTQHEIVCWWIVKNTVWVNNKRALLKQCVCVFSVGGRCHPSRSLWLQDQEHQRPRQLWRRWEGEGSGIQLMSNPATGDEEGGRSEEEGGRSEEEGGRSVQDGCLRIMYKHSECDSLWKQTTKISDFELFLFNQEWWDLTLDIHSCSCTIALHFYMYIIGGRHNNRVHKRRVTFMKCRAKIGFIMAVNLTCSNRSADDRWRVVTDQQMTADV